MKIQMFLLCVMGLAGMCIAGQEKAIVLVQAGCPLEIFEFSAGYSPASEGGSFIRGHGEQIEFSAKVANKSDKTVVAYRLGFVAFDIFEEFIGKYSGWAIEDIKPSKSKVGGWGYSSFEAFTFKIYGTGVAYVDAVRFDDGTFWRMNEDDIIAQIQKIEKSFSREKLKDAPSEK